MIPRHVILDLILSIIIRNIMIEQYKYKYKYIYIYIYIYINVYREREIDREIQNAKDG